MTIFEWFEIMLTSYSNYGINAASNPINKETKRLTINTVLKRHRNRKITWS